MQLFEIVLPVLDNSGQSYEGSHIAFREYLLDAVGGYTLEPNAAGGWRDDKGTTYLDVVTPYRVACEPEQWAHVVNKAAELFSDQLALFWSNIGTATIWERKAA